MATHAAHHESVPALQILRCEHCTTLLPPETLRCSSCRRAELTPVSCCGTGSIVSWKLLHRSVREDQITPSTIAIVELDEGPWVYTKIEGSLPERAEAPVRVEFRRTPTVDRFPVFGVRAA
ncbi:OB-fold domain-containing protein [Rhodococcus sp. Z13]|uniref:OB-fold domain-containing protein n=1 Tax=Rhodococcus sacchari TaxID=2962047 RepID=A0ACD4DAX1_9NOCA|nr:OB-fold domain-containing protein [Rhodococcus sp. Z13]UYP17175.1 OB-fold domain-containing protein [Rhodococcus sp. Z13]